MIKKIRSIDYDDDDHRHHNYHHHHHHRYYIKDVVICVRVCVQECIWACVFCGWMRTRVLCLYILVYAHLYVGVCVCSCERECFYEGTSASTLPSSFSFLWYRSAFAIETQWRITRCGSSDLWRNIICTVRSRVAWSIWLPILSASRYLTHPLVLMTRNL